MFKKLSFLFTLLLSFASTAQNPYKPAQNLNVHLEGLIVGAVNAPLYLVNQNIQKGRAAHTTITTNSKGEFSADFTVPFPDYYYLRMENGQGVNLVLKGNDSIKIYADAKDILFNCNIIGSHDSDQMKEFYQKYVPFKHFEDSLRLVLQNDKTKQDEVNAAFQTKAQDFYAYRNNFIQFNTNSPSLLASLSAVNKDTEFNLYQQVVTQLQKVFPKSPTVNSLGRQMMQLKQEKELAKTIAPGKMAPDIAVPNINGDTIRLSDLRGKVVLVDFWASWCGPCRRENPNVVKAYNKYNKDGFEVFSVSFDKPGQKSRWEAAIKQDGLIWPNHGSELNGFNNQAARDYGVRGIPFTVLIDAEGKIIAVKLRGPQLEAELQKIFGH
ncbi:MAG: redoxin domain-containing protein [Putridiphycobacter sp.]